jgi:lysozyme
MAVMQDEPTMSPSAFNGVIDLSHFDPVADPEAAAAAGIVAVIHKATQGGSFRDDLFLQRRQRFKAAGLRWGSYHFCTTEAPPRQIDNYLAYADPAPDELICLDFEAERGAPAPGLSILVELVAEIRQRTGRLPVIYGGELLRQLAAAGRGDPLLSGCALWVARYSEAPGELPVLWGDWTLWQYTDGTAGPLPHEVAGIGRCDRSLFNGRRDDLLARWPLG